MVVPYMLTKVILALESIVSPIFATVRAWMPRNRLTVAQMVSIHLTRSGRFRAAFGISTDISGMHCVSAMAIQLANGSKSGSTLGTAIFNVFVLIQEVILRLPSPERHPTSWNRTIK
jgi:hypothetical protein